MSAAPTTTELIGSARAGDRDAFDRLFAHVYDELRGIAHHRLRRHRAGDALNTTGLVHEAYLRLVGHSALEPADRAHFLALASRAMRFVLVDHARARRMQKRGGDMQPVPLDEVQIAAAEREMDLVVLDEALERLGGLDEQLGRLVELRFFGGLSYDEIAELTERSVRTVKRDWSRARTWLYTFMDAEA